MRPLRVPATASGPAGDWSLGRSHGQDDGERGAAPRLALDAHLAVVALHDRVGHRQPEPGAHFALGREEGIEDALPHVLGHADARVGDRQHHVIVPLGARVDAERSAVRHGVDGVQDQVGDDLVELGGPAHDGGQGREPEVEPERHAALGHALLPPRPRDGDGVLDHLVELDRDEGLVGPEPRELLDAPDRLGPAHRRRLDDGEPTADHVGVARGSWS